MLYVLYGNDEKRSREKLRRIISGLLDKKPNASHFILNSETFSTASLEEYISSSGLFESKYVVVLDNVFEDTQAREVVLDNPEKLAESKNIFILLERKLTSKEIDRLGKFASKIQSFNYETKGTKSGREFNIFSLTDSFSRRKRIDLWSLYIRALREGVTPEEILGILFWQVKTLLMVSRGETKNIKPFVIAKAKRSLENFSEDELKKISSEIVDVYHRVRDGQIDFEVGIEQLILAIQSATVNEVRTRISEFDEHIYIPDLAPQAT